MLTTLNINDENVKKSKLELLSFISSSLYRYHRYETDSSLALLHSDEAIHLESCTSQIRESDRIMQLNQNLVAIVFDNVSLEHGIKAGSNMLLNYANYKMKQNLYFAVTSTSIQESSLDKGEELLLLLRYAVKNNLNREVVDCYQLKGM